MKAQSNFVMRTITGSVFVIVILASMLNFWSFFVVMCILWSLMIFEYGKLLKENGKPSQIRSFGYSFLAYFYIILPFFCLITVYSKNPLYALALFAFVWVNDTFAYLFGITFGKHKLFERISPKKTWEGFFGGLIATIAFSIMFFKIFTRSPKFETLSIGQWIGLAIVVVIFGTIGDLFESYLKRSLNVKDSGTILPGHGGLLDRLDSILFAAPAVMVYLMLINW
ncbi:MAG: phosphatidate cytidylyltransferase [Bacteroidales bacterium]|jgi:phosphatidate cytidylyltransferase|nr:phosphatidate cytidylyltransferase [Bacteroidales bacterium]